MVEHSVLQPVDQTSLPNYENEDAAPWIMRKLVGSMAGRVVMASYETLRAAGTTVICLSPQIERDEWKWGDSNAITLPCIRFRDLVVHTVIVATGGTAAFVAPALAPVAEAFAASSFVSSIVVEVSNEAVVKTADWLLIDKPTDLLFGKNFAKLSTTSVKIFVITLKYKHLICDAALGFFRSPHHADTSLISSVSDYLSIEKGWFSPYLFASGRRPIIPRTMKPDIVFSHGPFLTGDYEIAEILLADSAIVLHFCVPPPPREKKPTETPIAEALETIKSTKSKLTSTLLPASDIPGESRLESTYKRLSGRLFKHGSKDEGSITETATSGSQETFGTPAEPGTPEPLPEGLDVTDINPLAETVTPPPDRRMIVMVLGIKPHRAAVWATSQRPSESVIQYILLNGCPTVVLPVKPGCPLLSWDTLTLTQLHQYGKDGRSTTGVVRVLLEFVGLCIDWARVILPSSHNEKDSGITEDTQGVAPSERTDGWDARKEQEVRDALELVVEGAVRSRESSQVKSKVDSDRAGIVMFRLP